MQIELAAAEINRGTISDNPLLREMQVLRDGIAAGFAQRVDEARQNPTGAIVEGAAAIATGAALTAGFLVGGRAAVVSKLVGASFGVGFALDASSRGIKSLDAAKSVWESKEAADKAKKVIADNLGVAAFDYGVMGLGGVIGSGGMLKLNRSKPVAVSLLDFADRNATSSSVLRHHASGLIRANVDEPVTFVPVTWSNVDRASAAAVEGFSYARDILKPDVDFKASVDSKLFDRVYAGNAHRPLDSRYFVAVDRHGAIAGNTGLYKYANDSDANWLGWFSVRPEFRGKGIGTKLLDFSISQARSDGRPFLRLYTSDHPGEAAAQLLYEKKGFKLSGIEPVNEHGVRIMYRERALQSPITERLSALGRTAYRAVERLGLTKPENSWIGKDGAQYQFTTPGVAKDASWHEIYLKNFPDSERQPIEFLERLSAPGSVPQVKLQVTERNGRTAAFSVTSDYGEGTQGRKLLMPYIATDSSLQSTGIGSQHLHRTFENLKEMYPTAKGMIIEMEPVDQPNISAAALKQRQDRLRFWTRNGGSLLDVKYEIPSSQQGEPPIPLKLMWLDFGKGKVSNQYLNELVTGIYKHGYELPDNHPLVKQFQSQF